MPIPGQNDIERMQRDAEHRIREMQKKADRAVRGNDMPPVPNFVRMNQGRQQNQGQNQNQNQNQNHSQGQNHNRGQSGQHGNMTMNRQNDRGRAQTVSNNPRQEPQKSGILSRFKGLDILKLFNFQNIHPDSDVIIIIALIFLLSTEETDELLLMALIYIML